MKFSLSPISLIIIPAILGLPAIVPAEAAAAASPIDNSPIEARVNLEVSGTITADVTPHTCPRTSCQSFERMNKGLQVTIACYTKKDTEIVDGNPRWVSLQGSPMNAWVPYGSVTSNGFAIAPC